MRHIDRRTFLRRATAMAAVGTAGLSVACSDATAPAPVELTDFNEAARLHIKPRAASQKPFVGSDVIWYNTDRRSYLRVPPTYRPDQQLPLMIAFHGGGGRGTDWVNYGKLTDAAGMVLLAPESANVTWDGVIGRLGADIDMVNFALAETFDRVNIDARRIVLMGFSDGASYALSLGLSNGDNVKQVIAHSPGFYLDVPRHGQPAFFVSHGTRDKVLPIEATSRVIVPLLRGYGDSVKYVEFDGSHELPDSIEAQAMGWLKAP
jgi:phospholipase/carboxylesterase